MSYQKQVLISRDLEVGLLGNVTLQGPHKYWQGEGVMNPYLLLDQGDFMQHRHLTLRPADTVTAQS